MQRTLRTRIGAVTLGSAPFSRWFDMRSVRCDVCGTRALIAASQCPKCSHLFELRDGFGELVPLAHCSQCDAFYPASVGSCKWCGTMPEPPRTAELIWKRIRWTRVGWSRVGFGALIAMAWVGWLLREPTPKPGSHKKAITKAAVPMSTVDDSVAPTQTLPPAVAQSPTVAPSAASSRIDTFTTTALPVVMPQAAPASAAAVPLAKPTHATGARRTTRSNRSSGSWVSSVAKSWVVVRSDARQDARIVCSLGPSSRVQLGEVRDGWRRIRSHGVAGWVDESRSSFAIARRSGRSSGFASR